MKRIILILCTVFITLYAAAEVKYIFYFIGDGMATNHVLGAEMYRSAVTGEPLGRVQTLMTTFPYMGYLTTYSASNGITDSAAAGTALATGSKTNNGSLGLDAKGDTLTSIAEDLKDLGWGIGILTSVAIDHATPASFYAHVAKRSSYYQIGQQLSASGFDFFGGAGFHHPQGKHDDKAENLYRLAEKAGYTIAHGYDEAKSFIDSDAPQSTMPDEPQIRKMILVQKGDDQGAKHGECIPYAIDRREGDLTLAQITDAAIHFMTERKDRFFMMIEGGMIDYASHGNDAATVFGEVWAMNEAMAVAYEFYQAHPDETLIITTADHETGGLSLGIGGKYILDLDQLQYQKCSSWVLSDLFSTLFEQNPKPEWDEVKRIYREQLGFWDRVQLDEQETQELKALYKDACALKTKDKKTLYKTLNKLSDAGICLLNKKARIGWASEAHTAHGVPVFAIGAGAALFTGWHDNTEIVPLIRKAIEE